MRQPTIPKYEYFGIFRMYYWRMWLWTTLTCGDRQSEGFVGIFKVHRINNASSCYGKHCSLISWYSKTEYNTVDSTNKVWDLTIIVLCMLFAIVSLVSNYLGWTRCTSKGLFAWCFTVEVAKCHNKRCKYPLHLKGSTCLEQTVALRRSLHLKVSR